VAAIDTSNVTLFARTGLSILLNIPGQAMAQMRKASHQKRLIPHSLYVSLGRNYAIRQASYRKLFRHQLDPILIDEILTATTGKYALEVPGSRNNSQQFLNSG
jgi:hypothetical protein